MHCNKRTLKGSLSQAFSVPFLAFKDCGSVAVFYEKSFIIHCNENPIYLFLFWEFHGLNPNIHIHVPVNDLHIPRIGPDI
jgi:hypothetical protein